MPKMTESGVFVQMKLTKPSVDWNLQQPIKEQALFSALFYQCVEHTDPPDMSCQPNF